jgi:hypothetical protein
MENASLALIRLHAGMANIMKSVKDRGIKLKGADYKLMIEAYMKSLRHLTPQERKQYISLITE